MECCRRFNNMNQDKVKNYLGSLTNKQLVELLSTVLKARRCDEGTEEAYIQAHWCIAEVSRFKKDNGEGREDWEIKLLALHDAKQYERGWVDNASICQSSKCRACDTKLFSWAKHIICPVCGAKVYAT